jgi:hypothetical protein
MIKKLILSLVLLAFGLVRSLAADEPALTGKVAAIEGNNVKIEFVGELPVWAKKGGYLRTTSPDGKLVLRGAKIVSVEAGFITVTTVKAKEMKVGETFTLGKGKATAGC